jgi:hypothetical protein
MLSENCSTLIVSLHSELYIALCGVEQARNLKAGIVIQCYRSDEKSEDSIIIII